MKLSIIIPVFNEEKTIKKVIENVSQLKIRSVHIEVIVIDDASTDNTRREIKRATQKNTHVRYFTHSKNQGKGATIHTGAYHATGDYILIQDADLEYDSQDIPKLVGALEGKKSHVVYGTRLKRFPHMQKEEENKLFLLHFFGNRFLSFVTSILYGQWMTDIETGYKLFSLPLYKTMNLSSKGFAFEAEITAKILKKGIRIIEIPIITKPRGYKEGKKLRTIPDGWEALVTILKYRVFE